MIAKIADVINVHPENVGIAVIRPQDRSDVASLGRRLQPAFNADGNVLGVQLRITIGYASVADASAGLAELASQFVDSAAVSLLLSTNAITITIASIDAAPAVASVDAAGAAQSRAEDASTGLSTGALVTIIIAAVVGVVLVLLVVVYLFKRKSLAAAKPKFDDITMEMKG